MEYGVLIVGWVGGMWFGLFLGTIGTLFSLILYFHFFLSKKMKKILKLMDYPKFKSGDNLSETKDKKGFSFSENFGDIMGIIKQAQKDAQQ